MGEAIYSQASLNQNAKEGKNEYGLIAFWKPLNHTQLVEIIIVVSKCIVHSRKTNNLVKLEHGCAPGKWLQMKILSVCVGRIRMHV